MNDARHRSGSGPVLVIGSINEDITLRVERVPAPGETVTSAGIRRAPGGKGANQAVAAARAGAPVQMLGRIGDDAAGARMRDALAAEGVDCTRVIACPGISTGTAYITVARDGENTIVVDPGANGRLSTHDVVAAADAIADAAVVVMQLEIPVAAVAHAVERAVASATRPIVTLSPAQPVPSGLLRGLDPLLVNRPEAGALLGDPDLPGRDPARAALGLLELGPSSVVVTLGGQGAVLAQRGTQPRRFGAHPVDRVLDTTGAGDAFAGALAAALAAGEPLDGAVEAGLAAGAAAVGRRGAR